MATLIGLAVLVWLVYLACRDGRRAFSRKCTTNAVLRPLDVAEVDPNLLDLNRLRRDMDAACAVETWADDAATDTPEPADIAAEERETTLTRQLLAGTIEPSVYQRMVSALAHADAKSGGAR